MREQIGRTRDALLGLVRAHIELARAEFDEIKGEVAQVTALGAFAVACLILLALFLPIGLLLFLGEWLFGSIGWGVLHGSLALVAAAVTAVLVALGAAGLGRAIAGALLVGILTAIVFGLSLPNQLWAAIGDATGIAVDPAIRPLVVGTVVGALVGAVAGLVAGARAGAAPAGFVGGLLAGALLGAFSAITFGLQVGIALGVTAFLVCWPLFMGMGVARTGIDTEALKARFVPQGTIDTTKETIEWAKARLPLGPRS